MRYYIIPVDILYFIYSSVALDDVCCEFLFDRARKNELKESISNDSYRFDISKKKQIFADSFQPPGQSSTTLL